MPLCQFGWRFSKTSLRRVNYRHAAVSLCCFLSLLRHLLKPEIVSFFFNFSYSGFVLFLRLECCERCPSNSVQCQTSTKIMKVDWLIYWVCISMRRFWYFPKITVAEISEISSFLYFYLLLKSTFSWKNWDFFSFPTWLTYICEFLQFFKILDLYSETLNLPDCFLDAIRISGGQLYILKNRLFWNKNLFKKT